MIQDPNQLPTKSLLIRVNIYADSTEDAENFMDNFFDAAPEVHSYSYLKIKKQADEEAANEIGVGPKDN